MNRDYTGLTREQLEERLDAAEDVVVLWSWQGWLGSVEADATHELWLKWLELGGSSGPADNPHLGDEEISRLAAQRAHTRALTMKAMRDQGIVE